MSSLYSALIGVSGLKSEGLSAHNRRKVKVKSLSRVQLLATPWTAAHQAPLSMDFPGKSTGVGCHCLLRGKGMKECYFSRPRLGTGDLWLICQNWSTTIFINNFLLKCCDTHLFTHCLWLFFASVAAVSS